MTYFVYILKCSDETLYTGITVDLEKRTSAHNAGKGAKYTRGRRPVSVIYFEECADRPSALRREMEIKRMSRSEKMKIGNQNEN